MQQSLKNKKGDKPLHHKQKIQTQEYCFQCKHCSLQKVKSTNIYVPVYPYLQGMLFHITKYVKYLYANRNTEVYPLKSIWWLKLKCLYKQCNFLEKQKVHTIAKGKNCKFSCWFLTNFSIKCQQVTTSLIRSEQSLLYLHLKPLVPLPEPTSHRPPLLR